MPIQQTRREVLPKEGFLLFFTLLMISDINPRWISASGLKVMLTLRYTTAWWPQTRMLMAWTRTCGAEKGKAVIQVKVWSNESRKTVVTYAFLDNGCSSIFCTEALMKQLGINGLKIKIYLFLISTRTTSLACQSFTPGPYSSQPRNNRSKALQRANGLKRKLEREPKLWYNREIPPDEKNLEEGRAWYLPKRGSSLVSTSSRCVGVYHPLTMVCTTQKPQKIRVVFDCSAKFNLWARSSMICSSRLQNLPILLLEFWQDFENIQLQWWRKYNLCFTK